MEYDEKDSDISFTFTFETKKELIRKLAGIGKSERITNAVDLKKELYG